MIAKIYQFKALLAAFKELPPTLQRDPTTLELSGYPHLENVYSNILAFFLDPGCEHGFGSLFLESLLSVAGYDARQDGEGVEVKTEESTMSRKRIDLVIYTGTLIVGIENKRQSVVLGLTGQLIPYILIWLCCMKPGRLCWPLGFLVYAFFVIG